MQVTAHAGKDVEQGEHSSFAGGGETCTTTMEINIVVPQRVGNQSASRPSYTTPGHIPKG